MPLIDSITVDAHISLADLLDIIEGEDPKTYVTVRRFESGETYWYVFQVADLRYLSDADEWQLRANLTDALNLHESDRETEYQASQPGVRPGDHGVLLNGDEIVGVLRGEGGARGAGPPRGGGLMTANGGSGAAASREADRKPFSAFPALTTPAAVASRQEFDLDVTLSAKPVEGVTGGPVSIAQAPSEFSFDLQVIADGFSFPNGSKAQLDVVRDDFTKAKASIRLIAPDVTNPSGFRGVVEVQFFYEGNVCGIAKRVVTVGGDAPPADAPDAIESRASVSIPDHPAPDLTVTISEGADQGTLMWVFRSPHDLTKIPKEAIPKRFFNQTAKTFALEKVRQLAKWDKNPLTTVQMLGIAKDISASMPVAFWDVLAEVWDITKRADTGPPTILIVSKDPYIPWELAAMTENYFKPRQLDPDRPKFLGAQALVGKWVPPVPTPLGGDIPTLPPIPEAEVDTMVLFVGDYEAAEGNRPLPMAIEEGKKLALRYGGVRRTASMDDVADLVRNDIRNEAGEVLELDAIHFACHGEVNDDPRFNGIVLDDSGIRLSADMISGSTIGATSNPFVFLNACQLGTETESLDGSYGGMAGAFLGQGATGFISPLWSVDDDIAHLFAMEFYERVFDNEESVAKALFELRAKFNEDSSKPRSSYLAYVYYGHPELLITKKK